MRPVAAPLRRLSRSRRGGGFTILELAITLSVMAVLAVGILVPFVAQVAQRKVAETGRVLDDAKEALMGYATATGRLPCPALPDSDGFEKFAAGPPAGSLVNGECATWYGFLPAATLGFTPVDRDGYAIDGWALRQNRIRYAVSNQTITIPNTNPVVTVSNPFTKTDGMRDATPALLATADLLFVCGGGTAAVAGATPSCAGNATLTRNAPAVIWSSGSNAATGGVSVDERQNPHANLAAVPAGGSADRIFVSRVRTDVAGSEFDDTVTWLSVGNLVSRMVLGGQLP